MANNTRHFFTSESVTEGHPDKVCDQISDAVLDAILAQDTQAHVACETIATTGMVLVMGEISTNCYVDIPAIARQVVRDIGYDNANQGFDGSTCSVLTVIDEQSPDIAMGVNDALEARGREADAAAYDKTGAGDQGLMFGFACGAAPCVSAASWTRRPSSCPCPFRWPISWRAGWPRCARTVSCRTCARTARPR